MWTAALAIAALRSWAEREGRQPTYNSWQPVPEGQPSRTTLVHLFGSWANAMAAAGFERRGPGQRPRTTQIGQPCANPGCGRVIVNRGARGRCRRCYAHLRRHGVDWADPAPAARARIVAAIQRVAAQLGRPPKWSEYLAAVEGEGLKGPQYWFDSWAAAVEAAGFPKPGIGIGAPTHPLNPARRRVHKVSADRA